MAILRDRFQISGNIAHPRGGWLAYARTVARSRGLSRFCRSCVAMLAGVLSVCFPLAWAQASAPGEYQLKAAFLFNFAKFIDWPAASFSGQEASFSICILGVDPFGRSMDDLLQGKMIANRRVSVERSRQVADVRHCQVVFVSSSEKARVKEILDGLKGTNVLVVGETDGFAEAGGAIQFAIEDNHVRFLINTDAADRAGLKVSSNLLSLAHVVHDGGKNDRS
jgi:YfiR/HmsC-like